jgi:hypothetical protein
MAPQSNPLTEAHFQEIQRGLAAVTEAENQIKLAALAGIDLKEIAADVADAKDKLTRIKGVYFPGR